jgi:hypothetical protein
VDLAGHALPLVQHPRLARLGEQLGVQPGVLLHGGLQPGEQLAPLPVLAHELHPHAKRLAHYQDHGILKAIRSDVRVMRKPLWLKNPVSAVCRQMMKIQPDTASTMGFGNPPGAV